MSFIPIRFVSLKALTFCKEMGDLQGEAEVHGHLGFLMEKADRLSEARAHHVKVRAMQSCSEALCVFSY